MAPVRREYRVLTISPRAYCLCHRAFARRDGTADWQCLEELDSSDDILARFTYSAGYIDAVATQERDLKADGDFSGSIEMVYYHCNTMCSVYALTDANETTIERYRYDGYGEVDQCVVTTCPCPATSLSLQPLLRGRSVRPPPAVSDRLCS